MATRAPKANGLRQSRALRRIVRRDHGIVGRQTEAIAVALWIKTVCGQVPLHRFIILAVDEADNAFRSDGFADLRCSGLVVHFMARL